MFKDLLAITQEKVRYTTTQGLRVLEVGQREEEGADNKLVSPERGLHPRGDPPESVVGPGLGAGRAHSFPVQGLPLGQGHFCREGAQAGEGDVGGVPAACRLPPGSVILFLFISSPLPASLPWSHSGEPVSSSGLWLPAGFGQ